MLPVTILISVILIVVSLTRPPIKALCWLVILMFGYSQRLTIPIGHIEFNTVRIGLMALSFRCFTDAKIRRSFKWTPIDVLIIVNFFTILISLTQTVPFSIFPQRESSRFIETGLAYFVVRMAVQTKEDYIMFIKSFAIIGIPLAFLGAYQSVTGINPFGFWTKYFSFGLNSAAYNVELKRGNFYRATGTVDNYILFGLFFGAIIPIILGLWAEKSWSKIRILITLGILFIGALSSVSSAPLFGLVSAAALLACFPARRYMAVIVFLAFCGIMFIEIFSNRHFYEVFSRFAKDQSTAYYRVALINEAFGGGMTGHWIFGYGYVGAGPGNDNSNFHWKHLDMVNIYIGKMVWYGLVGLAPYLLVNILYYRRLMLAVRKAPDKATEWMLWCLTASLFGLNIAMMTVSALDQLNTALYMLMGAANSMPIIIAQRSGAKAAETIVVVVKRKREPPPETEMDPEIPSLPT